MAENPSRMIDTSTPPADSVKSTGADTPGQKISPNSIQELQQPAGADSLQTDSLKRAAMQDSLLRRKAFYKSLYMRYPESVDSFYNPFHYYTWQFFRADGSGISEALRFAPPTISIPIALSSSLNRALYYGYPSGFGGFIPSTGIFPIGFSPVGGTDFITCAEAAGIDFSGNGNNTVYFHPGKIISPEMSLYWENGVFAENILDIRFARPVTSNIRLGVFTSYRFLSHNDYTHQQGDIYRFYKDSYSFFGFDSSVVANEGTNPLTDELAAGFHLDWNINRHTRSFFSYSYSDIKNELLYQQQDNIMPLDTAPLLWERLIQYRNDIRFGLIGIGISPLRADIKMSIDRDINKRSPLSNRYRGNEPEYRGEQTRIGGSIRPYTTLGPDTLFAEYILDNSTKTLYTSRQWNSTAQTAQAGYIHRFQFGVFGGFLDAAGGHRFLGIEDSTGHLWTWSGGLRSTLAGQKIRVFARRDAAHYSIPFDVSEKIYGRLFDPYQAYGAEMFLAVKKAGVFLGYTYVDEIGGATLSHSWPHGVYPYEQPRSVFTIAPVFGTWRGLSISSRWMISDTKPYAKSQTALRYDITARNGRQHIMLDLVLDYWSDRDPFEIGKAEDRAIWSREIYDLYFKTTIQIKTFRLFYKVDNLLNRQFAYVPGYVMPGLTFRWGFNWLIQG
ncbi:MAG: hypothetical protein GF350_01495 [Chitinivibrionales bacterium]|nr:hypothetical protein [Chitinivibrionales bacterium]